MNTQVTRPGHMVPGWAPTDPREQCAEFDNRAAQAACDSAEDKADKLMSQWACAALLASLVFALAWGVGVMHQWEAASALHVIVFR